MDSSECRLENPDEHEVGTKMLQFGVFIQCFHHLGLTFVMVLSSTT